MVETTNAAYFRQDQGDFTSQVVELAASGRKVHYLECTFGQRHRSAVPVLALHGLGGYVSAVNYGCHS